jgi:hypothetical protein
LNGRNAGISVIEDFSGQSSEKNNDQIYDFTGFVLRILYGEMRECIFTVLIRSDHGTMDSYH